MLFAGAVEMEFAPVATVSQTPAQNKWDGNRTCHTLANRVALRRRHNPRLRHREWPQTCRSESATALIPNSKMPDAALATPNTDPHRPWRYFGVASSKDSASWTRA